MRLRRRRATTPASPKDKAPLHVTLGGAEPTSSDGTHIDLDSATLVELSRCTKPHAAVSVVAPTWAALRRAITPARLLGTSSDVTISVTQEPPPRSAAPSLPTAATVHWKSRGGAATVRVKSPQPLALSAVLQTVAGHPRLLAPSVRVALRDRGGEDYVVGNPHARYGGIDDTDHAAAVTFPVVDFTLRTAWPRISLETEAGEHVADEHDLLPPLDAPAVNPSGSTRARRGDHAVATRSGDGIDVHDAAGVPLLEWRPGSSFTARAKQRLRSLAWVEIDVSHGDVAEPCRFIVEAAAAGGYIVATRLAEPARAMLGGALSDEVTTDRRGLDNPLLWEAARVRQTRAALRDHSPAAVWQRVHPGSRRTVPEVSVLLVTRRPEMVGAALAKVQAQTYPRLQLVLGLHGDGFDLRCLRDAVEAFPFPAEVVQIPASVPFGDALNDAMALCDGRLITKFDDDDEYGSEHVWDLVLASDYSGATITGKGAEFTALLERGIVVRRYENGGEQFQRRVAGGTMLFARSVVEAVDGWSPVQRFADDALMRQVLDVGGSIYRTHPFGYVLNRGRHGHTWDPGDEWFLQRDWPQWPASRALEDVILEQTTTVPL